MPTDAAKETGRAQPLVADRIQSFTSNGFVIGTDTLVNETGVTYHWIAMRSGVHVTTGVYTGDGVDSRDITGLPFQPDWIMTIGDGENDVFRPGLLAGDASYVLDSAASVANRIQAINADGFEVGSHDTINRNGIDYYYVAFDDTAKVAIGSYAGDDVDNRNISTGVDPEWVWVKRADTSPSVWHSASMSFDDTAYWDGTAFQANRIQDLTAGGFQVGTHAQVNNAIGTTTYYYLAVEP
jgi:hypothetical protein